MATQAQTVLRLARRRGFVRARDLAPLGIPRVALTRLTAAGDLIRVGRGVYEPSETDAGEFHSFALAAKRVPGGVICLLSALSFHGLTTQSPFEVWMAVARTARRPSVDAIPMRFVRFSGEAFVYGIECRRIERVPVRVTSPAKTVADCFKYRNKIGLDVAIEALREYRRTRAGSIDDLWRAARVCRVARVIRPYMEMVT